MSRLDALFATFEFYESNLLSITYPADAADTLELRLERFTYTFDEHDEGIFVPGRLRFTGVQGLTADPDWRVIDWENSRVQLLGNQHDAPRDQAGLEHCFLFISAYPYGREAAVSLALEFRCADAAWLPDDPQAEARVGPAVDPP